MRARPIVRAPAGRSKILRTLSSPLEIRSRIRHRHSRAQDSPRPPSSPFGLKQGVKGKHISSQLRADITRAVRAGGTFREIAARFGVHHRTVAALAAKIGVTHPVGRPPPTGAA